VAARIRKQLGLETKQIAGNYGEFTVLVDGERLMGGGPLGWLGVLPSPRAVVEAMRARLSG